MAESEEEMMVGWVEGGKDDGWMVEREEEMIVEREEEQMFGWLKGWKS